MHKIGLRTLSAFAVIAFAIPLAAQKTVCPQTGPCPVNLPKPPKLLSYKAEIKIHSVQTLADGTTITRDSNELAARDSQGRFLSSRTGPFALGNSADDTITSANANDPVDGTRSNWNSRTRKATVIKMPPGDQLRGCWVSDSGTTSMSFGGQRLAQPPPTGSIGTGSGLAGGSITASVGPLSTPPIRPRPTKEDLGTAAIMGLEAHGTRMTFTTPVGEIGNDRPLVRSTETWTAPGLFLPLRQITNDPRTGTETREVVSLDLSEPPISTFQPPEGYEIQVDEMHEVPCQQQTVQ